MSDNSPNPLEGLLSEFSLGPAWARAKSDTPEKKFRDGGEREFKPRRRDDNRGRSNDRNQRGGGERRDDRLQGAGAGNQRNFRNDVRDRENFQREEIAPAPGVSVGLNPEKKAIQLICKEIHHVARVYPLFDVAQIILAERARSSATFEISEKKQPFYSCKFEDAIFLTKEEALNHLLQADWRNRFIEESTVEVDPPKGNFQSVAKCGISGEWLGPPNYHNYQLEIRRIHRERFSNMPFESYLAKVRTERSEEAVNAWLETMKNQTRWRILSEEESAAVAANAIRQAENPTPVAVPLAETVAEPEVSPEESPAPEASIEEIAEEASSEAPTEETPAEETPIAEAPAEAPVTDDIKWFTDRAEFERAISGELLEKAFHITRKAKVSAAISGKNLSPGLLVRLKATGTHHRKHPAILIPVICKILETEHMAVFKRKGKLFTGPTRPQALAADAVLAPRPAEIVSWIRGNPPAKLEGLWKAILPEGATAPPAEYAADLFWLLQQGHILLYTDDTLVVQEKPKPQEPKKPKAPKKKAKKAASEKPPTATEEASPEATEPATPEVSEAVSPEITEVPESLVSEEPAATEESTEVFPEIPSKDTPADL